MGLTEYKRKRNFKITAEPAGKKALPKAVRGASRFVIQKHDASRLHYDFRLEMEGVLKSWAVPKGLPWGKGEKHLAVEVEDHPVEYATFEGVIPEGQYGGGTVMVWDRGTYYVYGENPLDGLKKGRLHLVLHGDKIKGEWALIRTRMEATKPQWLLLKATESAKPISKKADDQSVATGRTMKQIANDRDEEWQSNRVEEQNGRSKFKARIQAALKKNENRGGKGAAAKNKKAPARGKDRETRPPKRTRERGGAGLIELPANLPKAKPRFIKPMKPKLVEEPPVHGDWFYELKFDGIRAEAIKKGAKVELISRNGNNLVGRFPEVAAAVKGIRAEGCVIDGEVVAVDDTGRSSFQLLQAREMGQEKSPLFYYVFDLLHLNGRELMGLPVEDRKELLRALCGDQSEPIRYSGGIEGDPAQLLKEVQRRGLEGLIGKEVGSVYEADRRSGAWIKLKSVNEQEFVIGGWTPPAGARKYFGAVLVGYFENKRLLFAGKVGTGFDAGLLRELHRMFLEREQKECPFADLPSKKEGKWVQGITPAQFRLCRWVKPELVCQVKFTEWTRDGKLRQPVFLGLREDKDARKVVRERPQ